jgi:predicted  nucleic acid-binding Zn-ribbon protein
MSPSALDGVIQRLWERARQVSELLQQMRAENDALRSRIGQLEESERRLQRQVEEGAAALRQAEAQLRQLQNSNGNSIFSKEEQEHIVATIKDLIQKLNSRL